MSFAKCVERNGFEVIMFYVGLGDVRLNIERVAARVRNAVIILNQLIFLRRHHTSLKNLLKHLNLIDHLIVIDNSSTEGEIMLEADRETIKNYEKLLPEWVQNIDSHLKTRNNDLN
ncbi:hypothetical protein PALU110988_09475 [Paenibacillus lupini]|uniref:hypothetical protein n=1 Tax=Paenibacillus lupini TaxID=1450204 RepID=UPI001FBB254E|nr:hypothetical protein [Paenibacillus lupini]NIK22049.1 putative ABC-type ATPase [Paenibacillus lupini]